MAPGLGRVDKIRAGTDTNIALCRHPSQHRCAWTTWPTSRNRFEVRMPLSTGIGWPFDLPSSRQFRRTAKRCRQRPLLHRRQHK